MRILLTSAPEGFVASLVTSRPIAQLTASFGTFVMTALPRAFLFARKARLSTFFIAVTVHATIFALHRTWRTRVRTVRFTNV